MATQSNGIMAHGVSVTFNTRSVRHNAIRLLHFNTYFLDTHCYTVNRGNKCSDSRKSQDTVTHGLCHCSGGRITTDRPTHGAREFIFCKANEVSLSPYSFFPSYSVPSFPLLFRSSPPPADGK